MANKKPSELTAAALPAANTGVLVIENVAGDVEKITKADLLKGAGTASVLIGTGSAAGLNAVSLGVSSIASGDDGFAAMGGTASADDTISIGALSSATVIGAVAIGFDCDATGEDSTAIGRSAKSSAANAFAFGSFCQATAAYSTSLGFGSQATAAYSVALGGAVVNGVAHTASIGAAGLIIRESTGLGNPPANAGMLFVEDNGAGKSRIVIKWPDGTTEVLATQA